MVAGGCAAWTRGRRGSSTTSSEWYVPTPRSATRPARWPSSRSGASSCVPLLIGITFISFLVIHLAPGEPIDIQTPEDPNASVEVREGLRELFGLDQPLHVQYWHWVSRVVRLNSAAPSCPTAGPC